MECNLHLVKTTSWQHRFLDLTNLAPLWFCTYESMKCTLQNFFQPETGLPEWIFQIWPKNFKSDPVLEYMIKSLFWAFFGPPKFSRPLGILKGGAWSVKVQKNEIQQRNYLPIKNLYKNQMFEMYKTLFVSSTAGGWITGGVQPPCFFFKKNLI